MITYKKINSDGELFIECEINGIKVGVVEDTLTHILLNTNRYKMLESYFKTEILPMLTHGSKWTIDIDNVVRLAEKELNVDKDFRVDIELLELFIAKYHKSDKLQVIKSNFNRFYDKVKNL